MFAPRQNIVLLFGVLLLTIVLFLKGHDTTSRRNVVAFLPGARIAPGSIVLRLAGDVESAGLYCYTPGVNHQAVINMTVPHAQIGRSILAGVLQRTSSGTIVTVTVKGSEIIDVFEKDMSVQDRMVLGIPLNINLLDSAGWECLPGIGKKTAEKILAHRQKYGDFSSVSDLEAVPGIGARTLEKISMYCASR